MPYLRRAIERHRHPVHQTLHQRQMRIGVAMGTEARPATTPIQLQRHEEAKLNVKRIGSHDLPLPRQETMEAAGYDLRAAAPITIYPGERVAIPTGFAVAVPVGMVGLIWPRSGLAIKRGLDTLAGVLDADYRGEVHAVLINHGEDPVQIFEADRIAQLVVVPCYQTGMREVAELPVTERGAGSFGSTGAT